MRGGGASQHFSSSDFPFVCSFCVNSCMVGVPLMAHWWSILG